MSEYTTFLFARPTAIEGVARVVDIGGFLTEFNESRNDDQADSIAIRMDWKAVGAYLRHAMSVAEQEFQEQGESG